MDRRRFLLTSATYATLAGCSKLSFLETTPVVSYPGMREGHLLRDAMPLPAPSGEITTDVAILGSGAAALMAAWKLSKEGFHRFVVLEGPEFGGNASAGRFGELAFPRGAHYLPLPSMESVHIREMLLDVGVLLRNPMSERPYFDETVIVHAPEARIHYRNKWQDGPLPAKDIPADELAQQDRFFQHVESLKLARGGDGRKVFCIPVEHSSRDERWLQLDRVSFKQWLDEHAYTAETLHWYLNYACRDDYGTDYTRVSAWAGLHYFASRSGHAENAGDGAVLTWPDGLNGLMRCLVEVIDRRQHEAAIGPQRGRELWRQTGFAIRAEERRSGVEVLCLEHTSDGPRAFVLRAKRVVFAMPVFIASRVFPSIGHYGFSPRDQTPSYAPWLVSNFLMSRFPAERPGAPLSWDNVVYKGRGLGYVVSTHQDLRVARPAKTVFSAYQALSGETPDQARKWLARAMPRELYQQAACDLEEVYGLRFPLCVESLDITVRGHAMAAPLRGFLSNKGLSALRAADGRVLFAHSDLSGLSVFEEATWWGYTAARRLLG